MRCKELVTDTLLQTYRQGLDRIQLGEATGVQMPMRIRFRIRRERWQIITQSTQEPQIKRRTIAAKHNAIASHLFLSLKYARFKIAERHRRRSMRTLYTQILAQITTLSFIHELQHLPSTPRARLHRTCALINRRLRRLSHCQVINYHWHLLTLPNLSGCNECQCPRCTYEAATSLHWRRVSAHVVLMMPAPRNAVFVRIKSLIRERSPPTHINT